MNENDSGSTNLYLTIYLVYSCLEVEKNILFYFYKIN